MKAVHKWRSNCSFGRRLSFQRLVRILERLVHGVMEVVHPQGTPNFNFLRVAGLNNHVSCLPGRAKKRPNSLSASPGRIRPVFHTPHIGVHGGVEGLGGAEVQK